MSDTLNVVPDDLDRYASTLRDRTAEVQGAVSYCKEWLSPPAGFMGIYAEAAATVERIRTELVANYERLAALTDGSASELLATAQRYRDVDVTGATDIGRVGG